jgi:hypothetical protein
LAFETTGIAVVLIYSSVRFRTCWILRVRRGAGQASDRAIRKSNASLEPSEMVLCSEFQRLVGSSGFICTIRRVGLDRLPLATNSILWDTSL